MWSIPHAVIGEGNVKNLKRPVAGVIAYVTDEIGVFGFSGALLGLKRTMRYRTRATTYWGTDLYSPSRHSPWGTSGHEAMKTRRVGGTVDSFKTKPFSCMLTSWPTWQVFSPSR